MIIAGIFEFILGNTFPFVVSCGFGNMPLRSIDIHRKNSDLFHQADSGLQWAPP
jgi:hypothetical protein